MTADKGPLYGTRPSMPSGTSFWGGRPLWPYRSPPPRSIAPIDPMPRYTLYVLAWYSTVSPVDSSVPASNPPSMTTEAPAASALLISPENLTPPSATIGTPLPSSTLAQSAIAVSCGIPEPDTMRVVQIDPGPTPTLTASTPAFSNSLAASAVAMLPATNSTV